jgi:outer membrane protein
VPQALSGYRPKVALTASAGYQYTNVNSTQGGTPTDILRTPLHGANAPRSAGLTVTQTLFNGNQTANKTRAAESQVSGAREALRVLEQSVLLTAATIYMDYLRDAAILEVQKSNTRVLEQTLKQTQDRFNVGEVTRTDVAQAESSLAQATANRIASEGQLEVSRAAYTHAVGHPPGRLLLAKERPVLPASRDETLALAVTNNPNVIAANFAEAAARDNIDVVRGQLLPQISIIGDLNRSFSPSITLKGSREDTASAVLQMTMPLYEGGAIYSQTRAAQQTVGQRRSQVDDARRQAVQNATQAWETLMSARASVASFGAAVKAAQIALEGTQQEALVGSRTVLDVLISEQQLFTTQSQLAQAQHDAALAEYSVAAAIGRLVAPELRLPVQLYDMDKHYFGVKDKLFGFGGGLKE